MVGRIRELCEGKYTTFGALEKKLGFANGSLRKTDEKIQAVRLKMLADYFGVSMEYLLTGAETPTEPLSDSERELLRLFRKLNATGQSDALRRISELIQLGYTADKKGLSSDSDEVTA